jgi:site-specific recombinase XerC
MDEVRRRIRLKHYSLRTEQAYVGWIRRFILANGKRHPRQLGAAEVEAFLSALATDGDVAEGTQNQALSAILFLYREVLRLDPPWLSNVVRAKRPRRLPVVLAKDEVVRLLAVMEGRTWLMASLLYGTGMRLMEQPPFRARKKPHRCGSKVSYIGVPVQRCYAVFISFGLRGDFAKRLPSSLRSAVRPSVRAVTLSRL